MCKVYSVVTLALILLSSSVTGTVIRVPSDQLTIQSGMDAAAEGDTVLVAAGSYQGGRFEYKSIVLMSEDGPLTTFIDSEVGLGKGIGVGVYNNLDTESAIIGFTIIRYGPAILCARSRLIIEDCIITENIAPMSCSTGEYGGCAGGVGAGVQCLDGAEVRISNSLFRSNTVEGEDYEDDLNPRSQGGTIFLWGAHASLEVRACVFENNTAEYGLGGAIYQSRGSLDVTNCTFVGNSSFKGGAIYVDWSFSTRISNSVIYANSADSAGAIYNLDDSPDINLVCNDIFENGNMPLSMSIEGQANINNNFSADPLFCDATDGDYHLSILSPCAAGNNSCATLIGALDPACGLRICGDVDLNGELSEDDIGAMWAAYFAPPRYFPTPNGDMDCDDRITIADLVLLIAYIHGYGPTPCCAPPPKRPDLPGLLTE